MKEVFLHRAWRKMERLHPKLDADDGFAYTVRYAGRYAPGAGADFKDAVLTRSDGALIRGDVEIHINEDDWRKHKHNHDANYNSVVLHVALRFGAAPAETADGRRPPCVLLNLERLSELRFNAGAPVRADLSADEMRLAGVERFINRASGFRLEILADGAEQALYAGLLECLGYSQNRGGFLRLARRLPWLTLTQLDDSRIGAAALYAAGFAKRPPGVPPLNGAAPHWKRNCGRPQNRPLNRIQAAEGLMVAMARAGGVIPYCRRVLDSPADHERQINLLRCGSPPRRIGRDRALEMLVNAVLPALFALSELECDKRGGAAALQIYKNLPAPAPNALVKEAARLFSVNGAPPRGLKAYEQQGLIRLYRAFIADRLQADNRN